MRKYLAILLVLAIGMTVLCCTSTSNKYAESPAVTEDSVAAPSARPSEAPARRRPIPSVHRAEPAPPAGPREAPAPSPGPREAPTSAARLREAPAPAARSPELYRSRQSADLEVDLILENLKSGEFIFDAPTLTTFNEPKIIELTLYPPAVEIIDQPGPEQIRDSALISNRMEAILSADAFAIRELAPSIQAISGSKPTLWRWEIIPAKGGTHTINLSLLAHLIVDGESTPYVIKTYDREIVVEVKVQQTVWMFISKNWTWIVGTLLIPLLGFVYRERRRKK